MQDILSAELPTTTTINALRLAELAHPDNGHVTITWLELCDLWQCKQGTARKHLGLLHTAGIVHYSSNSDGCAYVTFKKERTITRVDARNDAQKWQENCQPRALLLSDPPPPVYPSVDEARVDARNDAQKWQENCQPRALLSTEDPATYTHASAPLVGWLVNSSTTIQEKEPTNQPTAPEPESETPTEEQALAFALCMEVRMRPDKAKVIAASVPFWQVRDAIGAWHCGRISQGGTYQETPGIVVAALMGKTVLPPAPPEWERTDLYRRYRTRAERQQEASTVQAADPPRAQATRPPPGSAAAIWALFVASSGEDGYRDLDLDDEASTPDALVLRCPAHRMGWAERVEQRLVEGLGSVAGHPVMVRLEETCER